MLPSNSKLIAGKTAGCNNKILISSIDMITVSNRNTNKAEVYLKIKSNKYHLSPTPRGVATNSGLGGRSKLGPFLYRKYERGIKESNISSSCS